MIWMSWKKNCSLNIIFNETKKNLPFDLKWNVLKDKVVSKEGGIREKGARVYVTCEYLLHDLMSWLEMIFECNLWVVC
jgi:hypothetical protein